MTESIRSTYSENQANSVGWWQNEVTSNLKNWFRIVENKHLEAKLQYVPMLQTTGSLTMEKHSLEKQVVSVLQCDTTYRHFRVSFHIIRTTVFLWQTFVPSSYNDWLVNTMKWSLATLILNHSKFWGAQMRYSTAIECNILCMIEWN